MKKDLRNFGLIWSGIFLTIALFPLLHHQSLKPWALYLSVFFAITALLYPQIFSQTKFYQTWIKFGDFMGKINSKIIIFILFYFIFLPIGLVFKILKKDLLKKKLDKSSNSYFIDRVTQPGDMKNQF